MDLLTAIHTASPSRENGELIAVSKSTQSQDTSTEASSTPPASIVNLSDVRLALRLKPRTHTLYRILDLLATNVEPLSTFDIRTPSPRATPIVKALIDVTVPDFWHVLPKKERRQLSECLSSVGALGGIVARFRYLIASSEKYKPSDNPFRGRIEELFDLLNSILGNKGFIRRVWEWTNHGPAGAKQVLTWKEFASFVAGGKVLAAAAEADIHLGLDDEAVGRWIGNGKLYTIWLAHEIFRASSKVDMTNEVEWKELALMISRGLNLGRRDEFVENLTYPHIRADGSLERLGKLISALPSHDKYSYMNSLLRLLSLKHFPASPISGQAEEWWKEDSNIVSSVAGLLRCLVNEDEELQSSAVEWLAGNSGGGVGEPIGIRRALVVVLAKDHMVLKRLLESSLQQFTDKLWIKHAPVLRQEANVQLLLLCAGYIHRHLPSDLARLVRSSKYLNGISNRVGATSTRPQFLGLVVGESLSALVDSEALKLTFGVTETTTEEAKWWKSIPSVEDTVGSALDLIYTALVAPKRKPKVRQTASSAIQVIEEVNDKEKDEEEDDDLFPYPKPDSDAEDSEEDAADIVRKKDTAPVYIRDLLSMLRDTESYERQKLALSSAASLIRRKATFGKELSDNVVELTTYIAGMHDKFDMTNFQEMRLQALIALVVSAPATVGPLLARLYFEGDYSVGQRAGVLSAIGMGARELGGFKDDDLPLSIESEKGKSSSELFPSKRLPKNVEAAWQSAKQPLPMEWIVGGLERLMMQPMAAEAADQLTGPNVLKVRTFSSRMEVEKKRARPAENKLGKVVASGFYFQLTGRWWAASKDFSGHGVLFKPFLTALFLKTLAIILHAAGPSGTALPQMTSELWELAFNIRPADDASVLEALLFAILTLLEVNEESSNSLPDNEPKKLLETQAWVTGIITEEVGGEKVLALAAAVLVRITDMVKGYESRLMGDRMALE